MWANYVSFACVYIRPHEFSSTSLFFSLIFFLLGIPVFETVPTLFPLYDLIIESQLHEEGEASPPALAKSMRFYAVSIRHLDNILLDNIYFFCF